MASQPPLYRLPDELLLQIAGQLRARSSSAELACLRNLCLASKKLYSIAQEQLYASAILPISCGCHPEVNAAVQLLRTLLERPELASKVKDIRFSIVRRSVTRIYQEKDYDLHEVREKCLTKLTEFGYRNGHPWWTSLVNNIESAYSGVLLSLLLNLERLDFVAKDHHRGWPTAEPISAFYGTSTAPPAVTNALRNIRTLVTADLSFIRELDFLNLSTLDLRRANLTTVLRLNGPHSLRGATQLKELSLGLSIQFLHKEYLVEMDVGLGDIFAALGCNKLRALRITLCNDAYSIDTDPTFKVRYFIKQMSSISQMLHSLEIDLGPEDDDEWEWFLAHCKLPISSLKNFPELRRLKMPQEFLFMNFPDGLGILPIDLPRKLECLEIVVPDDDIAEWAKNFLTTGVDLPDMKTIILNCRNGVNVPVSAFCEQVSRVWPRLYATSGIEGFVYDRTTGEQKSLVILYETSPEDEDESDHDDDNGKEDEHMAEEGSWEEGDDVPSLEDLECSHDENHIGPIIDDVD